MYVPFFLLRFAPPTPFFFSLAILFFSDGCRTSSFESNRSCHTLTARRLAVSSCDSSGLPSRLWYTSNARVPGVRPTRPEWLGRYSIRWRLSLLFHRVYLAPDIDHAMFSLFAYGFPYMARMFDDLKSGARFSCSWCLTNCFFCRISQHLP